MRKLRSRFFAFLMAICMITPLLCQPALASDSVGEELPDGFVSVSELGMDSFAVEPTDTASDPAVPDAPLPFAWSEGNRVLNITVYPLAMNPDTNELFIHQGIYDRITYSTIYQAEAGFALSPSQTLTLMKRLLDALASSSATQNCRLAGWRIESDINFYHSRPEYIIYRLKTSTSTSGDLRQDVRETSATYTFSGNFGYLTQGNIDPLKDYYYMGFNGEFYSKTSSGLSLGSVFAALVSFNCDYPTRPD